MTEDHSSIHALYCRLTKRDLPLGMSEHLRWNAWKARDWTNADLSLVINHINSLIAAGRRWPESLRLYNLIDPDRFNEDLAEARALARRPKVDKGKAAMLRAIGRDHLPDAGKEMVRSPAEILSADEALKKLLKLRDNL